MDHYEDHDKENVMPDEAELSKTYEKSVQGEWYSVSYHASDAPRDEYPRKRVNTRRLANAAIALVCAIAIALLAGVGGAFFAKQLLLSADQGTSGTLSGDSNLTFGENNGGTQNGTQNGDVQGGGTSNNTGGAVLGDDKPYPADTEAYDFAAAYAELQKNNSDALLGSPNGSAGEHAKSLVEITARVKDSVVEITTATLSNRGTIYAGAGSGVIIHEDGLIATNHHVIANCDEIVVRLTNGERYYATLRGTDEAGDIAILKIKPRAESPLTVAKLGYSKALALGEEVIAIGNPLGELGGTVTNGIISALEREVNVDGNTMTLLQTNAAINSDNSGGGLFNMAGELIGIVNPKYAASGVEGLGFAIPIDTVYAKSFADLLQHGYMRGIPSLGVALDDYQEGSFLFTYYGAFVVDARGHEHFQKDDFIYSIDGTVVYAINTSALDAIKTILRSHEIGDTVTVVVKRGNEDVTFSVTLVEYVPV